MYKRDALDPLPLSQTVTPSRTPSPPLERDVLYGRPLGWGKCSFSISPPRHCLLHVFTLVYDFSNDNATLEDNGLIQSVCIVVSARCIADELRMFVIWMDDGEINHPCLRDGDGRCKRIDSDDDSKIPNTQALVMLCVRQSLQTMCKSLRASSIWTRALRIGITIAYE